MPLRVVRRVAATLTAACLLGSAPLRAQDSSAVTAVDSVRILDDTSHLAATQANAPDTLPPLTRPISPGGALWRSLLVPGWGQARMGRSLTAGFFLAVEGVAVGMALKANSELKYMRETGSPSVDAKTMEREDWLVIVGVNHLLAGLEAYISAYLWDFPGDLHLQRTPNGTAAAVSLPVRFP